MQAGLGVYNKAVLPQLEDVCACLNRGVRWCVVVVFYMFFDSRQCSCVRTAWMKVRYVAGWKDVRESSW